MQKFVKKLKDKDMEDFANHVAQNAWGSPNVTTNVPENSDMKRNEIKLVGDDVYIKFPNGETKKFTGTDVS